MSRSRISLALALTALLTVPLAVTAAEAEEEKAPTQVLITNVDVWDGTSDTVSRGTDVLIEGDKIKRVAKGIKAAGAQVIDGQGGTLIPGLIDSHQHIMLSKDSGPQDIINNQLVYTPAYNAVPQGKTMLMMGVTTIRDTGGPSVELGMAIDAGLRGRPAHLLQSGPAWCPAPPATATLGGAAPGQGEGCTPGVRAQWWASALDFA